MECTTFKVTNTPLSHGELVVLLRVSLVFLVQVHLEQARVLSETSAVKVVCSPHSRSGESGTERLILSKREMPSHLPLPPLHVLLLSKPEVTELIQFQSFPSSLTSLKAPPLKVCLLHLPTLVPCQILRVSENRREPELVLVR